MENGKVMVMVMALGPGRLGKQRYLTWQWTGANFLWHYLLFHRKCACTPPKHYILLTAVSILLFPSSYRSS